MGVSESEKWKRVREGEREEEEEEFIYIHCAIILLLLPVYFDSRHLFAPSTRNRLNDELGETNKQKDRQTPREKSRPTITSQSNARHAKLAQVQEVALEGRRPARGGRFQLSAAANERVKRGRCHFWRWPQDATSVKPPGPADRRAPAN